MDRRGFLGSLMAVTAAVASGVKLPSGREVIKATPKALSVSNSLMAMLKDCRVVSIASNMSIDRLLTYEVEYIHYPGGGGKKTEEEEMIAEYTKAMRPINVRFTQAAGDLTRLNVEWM